MLGNWRTCCVPGSRNDAPFSLTRAGEPTTSTMSGWHISVYRVGDPEVIRDTLVRADFDRLHNSTGYTS